MGTRFSGFRHTNLIVEWYIGHDIGMTKHYLADNIKQEYFKFEKTIKLS